MRSLLRLQSSFTSMRLKYFLRQDPIFYCQVNALAVFAAISAILRVHPTKFLYVPPTISFIKLSQISLPLASFHWHQPHISHPSNWPFWVSSDSYVLPRPTTCINKKPSKISWPGDATHCRRLLATHSSSSATTLVSRNMRLRLLDVKPLHYLGYPNTLVAFSTHRIDVEIGWFRYWNSI